MRDPELVSRAHLAAVKLEQAWDRWRARSGLSATPAPPVSSYVGYSLEEPWGRPRVVFGVDAHEAELLAALLDRQVGRDPAEGDAARRGRELPAVPGGNREEPLTRAEQEQGWLASTGGGASVPATIAAELAGWSSGELPGQASARLAAWEAVRTGPAADPGQGAPPGAAPPGAAPPGADTAEPVTSG